MVWIQYSLTDGSQTGTNSVKVDDDELAALGKAQIEYDENASGMMVDISLDPHVVIPAPAG